MADSGGHPALYGGATGSGGYAAGSLAGPEGGAKGSGGYAAAAPSAGGKGAPVGGGGAGEPDASPAFSLEGPPTITSKDQQKAQNDVLRLFQQAFSEHAEGLTAALMRKRLHSEWLLRGLQNIPTGFAGLDASRPWFVFWISHSLEMLGSYDENVWPPKVASFLHQCQDPSGGFGGGPMQLPHLAPTYAATAALMVAGSEDAWKTADRQKMYEFLMRVKSPDGGFMMHEEGENDMRGTYCAMAVASMLHIVTDELTEGVAGYVRRCQTWEGGIAGEEGLEAHGGYSYCGLAALCIIGQADALDLHALLNWACHRQMSLEGGFQGRTNKLVDSCYSFWQGAIFPLIHEAFRQQGADVKLPESHTWFAPMPLQMYVLLACQHDRGGLRDKPGKSSDFYHTCYALSGVAAAQGPMVGAPTVGGDPEVNTLEKTDMYYNILLEKSLRKVDFFESAGPLLIGGVEVKGREGEGVVKYRKRIAEAAWQ